VNFVEKNISQLYPPFRKIFFKNAIAAPLMGSYDFIPKNVAHKNL
jgi:hypothetical protein